MSKHFFHIFKHIKGYRELMLKGVTQIYAEIPYKVFAVMPKDQVIEYFQMKPEFSEVEDHEKGTYIEGNYIEGKYISVTFHSKNEYFLNYRRERLIEFDKMINEMEKMQKEENFL